MTSSAPWYSGWGYTGECYKLALDTILMAPNHLGLYSFRSSLAGDFSSLSEATRDHHVGELLTPGKGVIAYRDAVLFQLVRLVHRLLGVSRD